MQVIAVDSKSRPTMEPTAFVYFKSPIGLVEIGGTAKAVTALNFVERPHASPGPNPVLQEALRQIEAYFAGKLRTFDVPLALQGTEFQQAVWRQLLTVAYGHTASYGEIARGIAKPRAVRAVGGANHCNPISLIVPCHRIIGSDGSLTGYGGGLWRKEWLLRLEEAIV